MRTRKHPRQPFAGLVLVAATAIFCAEKLPVDPAWFAAVLLLAAVPLILRPADWGVRIFVACAFFILHMLNHHLNPGRLLAREWDSGPQRIRGCGVVISEPEEKETVHGVAQSRFQVRLESVATGEAPNPCNAKVLMNWSGNRPVYGDRIQFSGIARNIAGPRNPGQMDAAAYFRRFGIYSEIRVRYATDGIIAGHGCGCPFIARAHDARRWMQEKLTLDLQDAPETSGLIQGMVLGLKDQTPEETRELFQCTGTLHLFVVNGLHIGMFALIAQYLMRPAGVNRRRSVFAVVPLLFFYTLVTGLNPGSIRATIMAAVVMGAELVERRPVSFNTLAAAAFAILAWDTEELFMPGFQFSFGVVFAIILLAGRFQRFFSRFGKPDAFLPRALWSAVDHARNFCAQHVAGLLGISAAAWIGSFPFTVRYFHLLSPGAVLANLVVVPMAFVVLSQGILALVTASFSASATMIFNNANWVMVHLILYVVRIFAQIPGGHIYVELPEWRPPACEITVFDFGAGGGLHLRAGGRNWLIDTGNPGAYENVVRPRLRMRGVNRLDGLMLTQGNTARAGGAILVPGDFTPGQLAVSTLRNRSPAQAMLYSKLAKLGLGKGIYEPDDVMWLAPDTTLRVLYPPPGTGARVSDDKALVLQLETCGIRVLLMSDSGFLTERWLLEHEPGLKSDILLKGQHASDISGTPDFLDAVQPRVIVCGGANFPAAMQIPTNWARDVSLRGITLFRQDETGAVRIEIRREGYCVTPFLGNQTFCSRSR